MYASKRRQRNFKRIREPTKPSATTNPSKRHRERLNGELETVAQLLPYDPTTLSRLDKLSVLRLAVSFLQVKAHFSACLHCDNFLAPLPLAFTHAYPFRPTPLPYPGIPSLCDSRTGHPLVDSKESDFTSLALKALGGFILILNDNGEIYYASENVEHFLGFHQSDILHQPLYDLIHSEDREDIRQQLDPNLSAPLEPFNPSPSFNIESLERNVNARFRCLLDNTCGFLRMDVRGKLVALHGLPSSYISERGGPTNANGTGAILGLIAVCTPFVPPSTCDSPAEELILKTKHQLDATLISMDERMCAILELDESDLPISFYRLVHPEDATSLAEAHKEVIKSGSSGLLIYRLIAQQSGKEYFVQSSARMFYKNGKMDAIGLTHRVLNEVEGTMLLEKRSSLKAKLLSFDDSLLQSPRTLQSTAALPVPASHAMGMLPGPSMKLDDELETEVPSPVAPVRAIRRKRTSPAQINQALLPHPSASLPLIPHQVPPQIPGSLLQPSTSTWNMPDLNPFIVNGDGTQPWMVPHAIIDWQNGVPTQFGQFGTAECSYFVPTGFEHIPQSHDAPPFGVLPPPPPLPHPPIAQIGTDLWQTSLANAPMLDITHMADDRAHLEYINKELPPGDYLLPPGNHHLNFISEVTNTLLGQ